MADYITLVILFFVIIDPFASFSVFLVATKHMKNSEKNKITFLAILVASLITLFFLVFGEGVLSILHTDIDHFRVAGGIILFILGLKMSLGYELFSSNGLENNTSRGVAAIIATPLITGPATITTIIISGGDYGGVVTGLGIFTVLLITGFMFYFSQWMMNILDETFVKVLTTILGLITVAWGINFVFVGLKAIFNIG